MTAMTHIAHKTAPVRAGRVDAETAENLLYVLNSHQAYLKADNTLIVDIEGAGKARVSMFGMFSVSIFPASADFNKPTGVVIYFDDFEKQAHQSARLAVRRARRWNPARRSMEA